MLKAIGIAAAASAICVGAAGSGAVAQPTSHARPTSTISAPAPLVGVSAHDNDLDIESSMSLAFSWDGNYSITSGQPWGGVTTTNGTPGGGSGIVIDADGGRSGSTGPAQWFMAHSQGPVMGEDSATNTPGDLNFAFTGTLTIDGHQYPVVIGQGHSGMNNNWWIGGQGAGWTHGVDGPTMADDVQYLTTPDGLYAITCETAMNNVFGVGLASGEN